jgi:hypothetical protein
MNGTDELPIIPSGQQSRKLRLETLFIYGAAAEKGVKKRSDPFISEARIPEQRQRHSIGRE